MPDTQGAHSFVLQKEGQAGKEAARHGLASSVPGNPSPKTLPPLPVAQNF